MPRKLKYNAGHYESSACHGLGTAGGVCPAMLLPCMILGDVRSIVPSQLLPTVNCSIMLLHGLGFNPSFIPIDATMLPAGLNLARPPAYLVSDRYHSINKQVKCENRALHRKVLDDSSNPVGETRLSLLDHNFRNLGRAIVRSEGCVKGVYRIGDARLLRVENSSVIFFAYTNFWSSHCQKRKGYFITPLNINLTRPPRPASQRPVPDRRTGEAARRRPRLHPVAAEVDGRDGLFVATMRHTSSDTAGRTDSGLQELTAPRNGGVLLRRDGTVVELVHVAPKTTFWTVPLSPQELATGEMDQRRLAHGEMRAEKLLAASAPRSFSANLHNSIHPIWVEEFNAYLAVGHIHYLPRQDDPGSYEFGSSYRQILFTIDEAKLSVRRFSRELCLPSLESSGEGNRRIDTEDRAVCDGVQFVMSGFRQGPTTFHFSYGINDCESALLTLSLSRIRELLEFSNEQP